MFWSILFLFPLIHQVVANPVPEPTPAPILEARAGCSQDNCLRALSNHATSASPYCSSYTKATQTATTGFPTYVPSTCGPSRVSSACTCLIPSSSTSSTSTATSCTHTGQVLSNPSFYGNPPGDSSVTPWVISHVSGSGPGCQLGPNGYSVADMEYGWGDPNYVTCSFNNTVGQDTISQTVTLCPGMNYTFIAHTACDYYQYRSGAVAIHFVVHFNGKTIIPSTQACVPCPKGSQCGFSSDTYYGVSAEVTAPATGTSTLQFVINGAAAPDGGQVLPLLLDTIFLNSAGYTGPECNPDVSGYGCTH